MKAANQWRKAAKISACNENASMAGLNSLLMSLFGGIEA